MAIISSNSLESPPFVGTFQINTCNLGFSQLREIVDQKNDLLESERLIGLLTRPTG